MFATYFLECQRLSDVDLVEMSEYRGLIKGLSEVKNLEEFLKPIVEVEKNVRDTTEEQDV